MNLIDRIKHHEGFVEHVYDDSLGIPTIGYGFAIKDLILDEDIAELILERKIEKLKSDACRRFEWLDDMPIAVSEVVLEMCYQLGVTGVSKFKKTIALLRDGNWEGASEEMLDSLWAKQTPNRAKELSNIIKEQDEEACR